MSRANAGPRPSVLGSPYFWISVAVGALLPILAAVGAPALPVALLGAVFGAVGGFITASAQRSPHVRTSDKGPAVPPEIAADTELARVYRILCDALALVADQPSGSHKEALTLRLVALGVQFRALASGAGGFAGTESWHVAHDAVLTVPELREYRALVRVSTAEYARDPAMQESLRAMFAAAHRGVLVERVLVLADSLWPRGQLLPSDDVRPWIEEQHNHGLRVILLRENELATDWAVDTCVFDDWAVGTRDLDGRCRTTRVALDFAPAAVRAALNRLDELSHLGISVRDLLERAERGG